MRIYLIYCGFHETISLFYLQVNGDAEKVTTNGDAKKETSEEQVEDKKDESEEGETKEETTEDPADATGKLKKLFMFFMSVMGNFYL